MRATQPNEGGDVPPRRNPPDPRGTPVGGRCAALAMAVLLLAACMTGSHYTSPVLERGGETHRVVLLPLDIELSLINAGGFSEPQAEWTDNARTFIRAAMDDRLENIDADLIFAAEIDRQRPFLDREIQLIKLNAAVGASILRHQYDPMNKLPTKEGRFDWTLGPEAQLLRRRYGADYALFVYVRDSYVSSGRVAVILLAALMGVAMSGGYQTGFASLVDLETGQVVWFNRLSRPSGDLRTEEAATRTVESLLEDFPK